MIQAGLYTLLSDTTAISSLATSITQVVLPLNPTFPALTYEDVSTVTESLLQGPGTTSKRIRFDCWGITYGDCKALQAAIHAVFDGFTGTLPDGTRVQETSLGNEIDMYESDTRVYRSLVEFIFYF